MICEIELLLLRASQIGSQLLLIVELDVTLFDLDGVVRFSLPPGVQRRLRRRLPGVS